MNSINLIDLGNNIYSFVQKEVVKKIEVFLYKDSHNIIQDIVDDRVDESLFSSIAFTIRDNQSLFIQGKVMAIFDRSYKVSIAKTTSFYHGIVATEVLEGTAQFVYNRVSHEITSSLRHKL